MPLPAADSTIALIRATRDAVDLHDWVESETRSGARKLSRMISTLLEWNLVGTESSSEQMSGIAMYLLLVGPIVQLDELLPSDVQLQLQVERDTGDAESGMTQLSETRRPLRPDLILRARDGWRVLLRGEEKVVGKLSDAVKDLAEKVKVWDEAWYGTLPYALAYAAAGPNVVIYAIPRDDVRNPCAVTREFNVLRLADRLRLLCVVVQLHRLMQATAAALPAVGAPMDKKLVVESQRREENGAVTWRREVFLESANVRVFKTVRGWGAYSAEFGSSLDAVRVAYSCAAPQGGLAVATSEPVVHRDTYRVTCKPLGVTREQSVPADENSLRAALHGALHGLAALHAAGVVHRDVRWANVARDALGAYFLFDFETCAFADAPVSSSLRCWGEHTLEEAPAAAGLPAGAMRFTRASDMHLVGLMMEAGVRERRIQLSAAGRRFQERLLAADPALRPTAEQALADPWLSCSGAGCQAAARPDAATRPW